MFVQHIFRSVTYLLLLNKLVILLSVSLYVRNVVFLSFCNEKVSFIVFHMTCPGITKRRNQLDFAKSTF